MVVASIEKGSCRDKAFGTFNYLRKKIPSANVATLRHVSVYLARTNDIFDATKDIKINFYNEDKSCLLLLNDGSEIRFSNVNSDSIQFEIDRCVDSSDGLVWMSITAEQLSVKSDDSIPDVQVIGEIIWNDWNYIVSNRCFKIGGTSVETFKSGELIDEEKCEICGLGMSDIHLDSIDGLNYITDVMVITDHLYQVLTKLKPKEKIKILDCFTV